MGAAWPVLCLLWGMVALTRLPCCTHEDKQAAGGDGNISPKMIEQGITGGCLSLSFCAWDRTICLYGNKLSIGCGVSFSHLKKMLAFSRLFFRILLFFLNICSVCLSKDSGFCYVVCAGQSMWWNCPFSIIGRVFTRGWGQPLRVSGYSCHTQTLLSGHPTPQRLSSQRLVTSNQWKLAKKSINRTLM